MVSYQLTSLLDISYRCWDSYLMGEYFLWIGKYSIYTSTGCNSLLHGIFHLILLHYTCLMGPFTGITVVIFVILVAKVSFLFGHWNWLLIDKIKANMKLKDVLQFYLNAFIPDILLNICDITRVYTLNIANVTVNPGELPVNISYLTRFKVKLSIVKRNKS